jgi:hypothetical protein
MPFTLEQLDFLSTHVGVEIPPAFLENKRRAETFKKKAGEMAARSEEMKQRQDGSSLEALFNQANAAAQANDFSAALELLDKVESGLNTPEAPPLEPTAETAAAAEPEAARPMAQRDPAKDGVFVKLQTSRHKWNETRGHVRTELESLEKAILDDCKQMNGDPNEELEVDLDELSKQTKQIFGIMDKMDERLIDTLDEALAAKDEQRGQKQKQAAAIVKEYQAILQSDPLIAQIDGSGFMNTSIRQTFAQALEELAGNL